jgi:hypothetical protein
MQFLLDVQFNLPNFNELIKGFLAAGQATRG